MTFEDARKITDEGLSVRTYGSALFWTILGFETDPEFGFVDVTIMCRTDPDRVKRVPLTDLEPVRLPGALVDSPAAHA